MKQPYFAEGDIYHIYNRGVEKRDIYLDDNDYLRFVHNLFEMNDMQPVTNFHYFFNQKTKTVESRFIRQERTRELLVEVLVFTLMPNHYHLMLRQLVDKGIPKFMQKLGTGYTMYFNKKNKRSGSLFQGTFKAAHIGTDEHFIHLPHYIHTNPIKLDHNGKSPIDHLQDYRWSSFADYTGGKNFPSVTSRDFLLNIFGGPDAYRKLTEERLDSIEV